MSITMLDLKKKQKDLHNEKAVYLRTKCEAVKKMRLEAYKQKSNELDAKERELCLKTNQLVDELVATCDNTPFHKALIKILSNLKGKIITFCSYRSPYFSLRFSTHFYTLKLNVPLRQ